MNSIVDPTNEVPPRGRLAPSPTGLMHLGNAWAMWVAWLGARSLGGEVVLRLEDIDPARSRDEYAVALLEDLAWLGLDWDLGPGLTDEAQFRQSRRLAVYQGILDQLSSRGLVYPCYCTRKELRELAGAPHVDDAGAPYPGTCRQLTCAERATLQRAGRRSCQRLVCPAGTIWDFEDLVLGPQSMTLDQCGGDFALRRSDGVFAYQLAVVVDDIAMGVTQVVRGRDILSSTPRQLYLYTVLGAKAPRYAHVPLITDAEGHRLAKRHQSLTLRSMREAGVRAESLLGWLAWQAGLAAEYMPMTAWTGLRGFAFKSIRAEDIRLPSEPVSYFLDLAG